MTFEACYNLGGKCFCDCLAFQIGSASLFSLPLSGSASAILWAWLGGAASPVSGPSLASWHRAPHARELRRLVNG